MGLIYARIRPAKRPRRKVGWREAEEQHARWLARWAPAPAAAPAPVKPLQVKRPAIDPARLTSDIPSLPPSPASRPPVIHDPRVLYRDDPELAARELRARAKKFLTGPVYNKGGDVLITAELLKDIASGATRRRS